jgi:hypothetical protein
MADPERTVKKRRRYPIPSGYPVPSKHIPDMPIDQYHLHAFGELTPPLCRAMGVKVMDCAYCGAETTLRLSREPLGAEGVRGEIGMLVWGQDVDVVCPCCSFQPRCVHRGGDRQEARDAG